MLLTLPEPNPAYTPDLADARHAHDVAGFTLGHQELAAAARILRSLLGENAARLLSVKDTDDDGNPTFTALLLFDRVGALTWFNRYNRRYDCWDYPGAAAISDDRRRPLLALARDLAQRRCDGEELPDGSTYLMENDAAVSALSLHIEQARRILPG